MLLVVSCIQGKIWLFQWVISKCYFDVKLQLVYEDLIDRAKDKEEKEAKKIKRLAKDFTELLSTVKVCDMYSRM